MATLTFSFETGAVTTASIVDAICGNYQYQATIPDPNSPGDTIANPESKAAFAKRMVKNFIVDNYKSYDRSVKVAAITNVDLTLT